MMNKFIKRTDDVEYIIETDDREIFKDTIEKILSSEKTVGIKSGRVEFTTEESIGKVVKQRDTLEDITRLPNEDDIYKLDPNDPDVVDLNELNVQTKEMTETVDFACPECSQHHALKLSDGYESDDDYKAVLFSYPYIDDKEDAKPLYMIDAKNTEEYFAYDEVRGFEYINALFIKLAKNESLEENIRLIPDADTRCSCPICDYNGTTLEFHKAYHKKNESSCPLCGNEGLILMGNNKNKQYSYECEFCSEKGEPFYY